MPDALWYPIYEDATKDVDMAGFFKDPDSVELQPGQVLGQGQDGEIPENLITMENDGTVIKNYTYNTETNQVEEKA